MILRFPYSRRIRLHLAALMTLTCVTAAQQALAQQYPTRPVRLLVGVAPGGVTDLAARIIAPKLGQALGQTFIVENRPGASGAIAATAAAKAAPDGYTLFLGNVADMAVNPALQPSLAYDTLKDFVAVAPVSNTALTVVVHPSVPANDLRGLIALAKAQPGKLSFATAGNGTVNQLVGEWIKHDAGIQMIHVPYKGGGPSTQDVLAGHVPIGVIAVSAARAHVHGGRLKLLGVSTAQRLSFEPGWPTIAESGFPGFNASVWVGLFAPASVPKPIVARLSAEMNRILKMPEVRDLFNAQGADVLTGTPEELTAMMRADRQRYGRMVQDFDIHMD
jgi:tripartite-type tricarboxylate transporter receptor subunit TctC